MKKTVMTILVLMIAAFATGCSEKASEKPAEPAVFKFMEGVTALTAGSMISEKPEMGRDVQYEIISSPDLLASSIIQGEADMAIVPTNLAAQARAKGADYVIAGTATWGNLYIVGTEAMDSLDGLKGKTVQTFGKGLTPELVLNMVLAEAGIDPKVDMDLKYMNSAAEVAPLLVSGKTSIGLLPEPALSSALAKNKDLKVLFDINKLWAEANKVEKGYPQSCLVVKKELVEEDPEFVEKFLEEYSKSIEWALENPEELGTISEEHSLGPDRESIVNGIGRMNIGQFPVGESLSEYRAYYKSVMDFDPEFIGGSIPDEEIYYER